MRIASALLAVLLVLTGLGQAVAQGRMAGAQVVEVCTEAGARTLTLDAEGNPVAAPHDCLACLLPALAGAPETPAPARPAAVAALRLAPADAAATGRAAPIPLARGPPAAV